MFASISISMSMYCYLCYVYVLESTSFCAYLYLSMYIYLYMSIYLWLPAYLRFFISNFSFHLAFSVACSVSLFVCWSVCLSRAPSLSLSRKEAVISSRPLSARAAEDFGHPHRGPGKKPLQLSLGLGGTGEPCKLRQVLLVVPGMTPAALKTYLLHPYSNFSFRGHRFGDAMAG